MTAEDFDLTVEDALARKVQQLQVDKAALQLEKAALQADLADVTAQLAASKASEAHLLQQLAELRLQTSRQRRAQSAEATAAATAMRSQGPSQPAADVAGSFAPQPSAPAAHAAAQSGHRHGNAALDSSDPTTTAGPSIHAAAAATPPEAAIGDGTHMPEGLDGMLPDLDELMQDTGVL
mgnify:CR=1 FL=1